MRPPSGLRSVALRTAAVVLALTQLADTPRQPASVSVPAIEGFTPSAAAAAQTPIDEDERRNCEAAIRDVLATPQAPGAPDFEAHRARLLFAAKAEPVLWVDTPRYSDDAEVPVWVKGYRKVIERAANPWALLKKFLPDLVQRPMVGRQMLLKQGYLFADNPELAFALARLIKPEHLFGHDHIWLQRGEYTYRAERKRGRYYYTDGPLQGHRVRLMHLDRLGYGEPSPSTLEQQALHRDLRSLRYRLHFNRMTVRHVTETHVVANLRYGEWWIPSLLRAQGPHLELECEIVGPGLVQKVTDARSDAARRQRAVQALRKVILEQVHERLPFDEPIHEYGHQLDGRLRKNWRHAYFEGYAGFAFNGDEYLVFDNEGRPFVPQVCVDFLTDTLERASGTWWRPKGQQPGRNVGHLDFDRLTDHRDELRQVPGFLALAEERTDWFEVHSPHERHWIPMRRRSRFVGQLLDNSAEFSDGDIVMIKGFTPWDPKRAHYHSFYVYETDPLTGIPIVLAGNAGRPSLRPWEVEARRTPKRAIHHRIRLRTDWLESIITEPIEGPLVPPPLSG